MPIRQGVVKMKTDVMVAIFANIDISCSIHKDRLVKLEKTIEHFPRFSVGKVLLEVVRIASASARSNRYVSLSLSLSRARSLSRLA